MAARKAFALRIIEFVLREALRKSGRLAKKDRQQDQ